MALERTVPSAVVAQQQELLALHLGRLLSRDASGVSPVLVRPFSVPEWAKPMIPAGMTWAPAAEASTEVDTVVCTVAIGCLRRDAANVARLLKGSGPAGRVVFSEIEKVAGWFGRPDAPGRSGEPGSAHEVFDTTGALWRQKMTVIDVDRVTVRSGRTRWHVVAGIARITPMIRPLIVRPQTD